MAPNTKKVKMTKDEDAQAQAFEKLANIQENISKIDDELEAETAILEAKYDKLKKPFFDQRKEFIAKIPDFWANVLAAHPLLSGYVGDKDMEVLKYINDVEVESDATKSTKVFKVIFKVKSNPFFTNTELWKKISSSKNGENVSMDVTQSGIDWKAGKNFLNKPAAEEGKKRKKSAVEEDIEDNEGFIAIFASETEHDEDFLSIIVDEIYGNPMSVLLGDIDESFIEDDE